MRETALATLVTNLEAILIANGYALNVQKVARYINVDDLSSQQYPALMVTDNDDEERLPKSSDRADVYFTVNITGFVNSADTASTDMNVLDKAIKKAVNADRTLGAVVANVTILPRLGTDLDGGETGSTFVRPVQVYYEANEANGD